MQCNVLVFVLLWCKHIHDSLHSVRPTCSTLTGKSLFLIQSPCVHATVILRLMLRLMLRPLFDTASIFSLAWHGCDFHQNSFSGDGEIISRRSWKLRLDLILVLEFSITTGVVCPARCLGGTWPSLHFEFSDLDGLGVQTLQEINRTWTIAVQVSFDFANRRY